MKRLDDKSKCQNSLNQCRYFLFWCKLLLQSWLSSRNSCITSNFRISAMHIIDALLLLTICLLFFSHSRSRIIDHVSVDFLDDDKKKRCRTMIPERKQTSLTTLLLDQNFFFFNRMLCITIRNETQRSNTCVTLDYYE